MMLGNSMLLSLACCGCGVVSANIKGEYHIGERVHSTQHDPVCESHSMLEQRMIFNTFHLRFNIRHEKVKFIFQSTETPALKATPHLFLPPPAPSHRIQPLIDWIFYFHFISIFVYFTYFHRTYNISLTSCELRWRFPKSINSIY